MLQAGSHMDMGHQVNRGTHAQSEQACVHSCTFKDTAMWRFYKEGTTPATRVEMLDHTCLH